MKSGVITRKSESGIQKFQMSGICYSPKHYSDCLVQS